MIAGTRTLSIEETLLEPSALPPPPTRHALFISLIALAILLHVATIGWGDLYSETEGQYAGAAREMVTAHQWLVPTNDGIPRLQKPPLLYWLIVVSFKLFGVSAAAARLPIALAVVATTALIFLIGERLTDYWRGFLAAVIYLSLSGTFLLARIIMPEPVFTAFVCAGMLCAVCGYQKRRLRGVWFLGWWLCAASACLTKSFLGLVYPIAIILLLSIFHREARLRFRALLRWEYLSIFAVIVAPWHVWAEIHFPGYIRNQIGSEWFGHMAGWSDALHDFVGVTRFEFLGMHLGWFFPWSIALLPGIIFAWRRAIRPREIEFADTLPVIWMAIVFLPLFPLGQRQDYYSMTMWPAFALWAAVVWECIPRNLRAAGMGAVIFIGLIIAGAGIFPLWTGANGDWGEMDARWTAWRALRDIPASAWTTLRPMFLITGISLAIGGALALYVIYAARRRFTCVVLVAAMIPTGLTMIDGVARMAPYFSLADIGRLLNSRLAEGDEVLFEGPLDDASSLVFYLNQPFIFVGQNRQKEAPFGGKIDIFLDEKMVLDKWGSSDEIFLIIDQHRAPHWQQLLTERFHIFHQVTMSGTYVVLSNQM
jgi:4-amino-4-deoxy-L-arabinose transferase-like glycosyltransferase